METDLDQAMAPGGDLDSLLTLYERTKQQQQSDAKEEIRKLECIKLQLQTEFDYQASGPTVSQVEENEDLLKKIDEAITA